MKFENEMLSRLCNTALAAGCSIFLAGCEGEPVYSSSSSPVERLARALHDVCGTPPVNPRPADVTVRIKFRDIGSGVLCPYDVDQACPLTFKSKKIGFLAVDESGNEFEDPPRFKVYFDPINGKTINAPNGAGGATIDEKAPAVIYKYTVWDWPEGDGDPVCDPLDPNFRVD
jgi:hypothetical protein